MTGFPRRFFEEIGQTGGRDPCDRADLDEAPEFLRIFGKHEVSLRVRDHRPDADQRQLMNHDLHPLRQAPGRELHEEI